MHIPVGKWGNCLAVRLPGTCVHAIGLRDGMNLDVKVVGDGLLLSPATKEYCLEELVARITEDNRHDETDWATAVGREAL